MGLEKRKANITFTSPNSVIITNPYYQKSFQLKSNYTIIDLISLKSLELNRFSILEPSEYTFSFCVCFYHLPYGSNNAYVGKVSFLKDKENREFESEIVDYKENNKNYSATVFVEEES